MANSNDNFLAGIDAKKLEEIKSRDEEYILLRKQAAELKLMKEQAEIARLEKLRQQEQEFEQLKQEVKECKAKLSNITKVKIKKRPKEEMDMLNKFFDEHIAFKTGSSIKTVDVMTKANEVLAVHKLRFNKFEVAQLMKDKGISKKKGANHTFYLDVKFV